MNTSSTISSASSASQPDPQAAPENERLAAALRYASKEHKVVRMQWPKNGACSCKLGKGCEHPAKHPRTEHGVLDASSDPAQIHQWWDECPEANVGLKTGERFFVFDVDPRNGGNESFARMTQKYGPLPETAQSETGGGGSHRFFAMPEGEELHGVTSLAGYSGIDIKAYNGIVTAPPSLHISGRHYAWVGTVRLPADAPAWLLDLIRAENKKKKKDGSGHSKFDPVAVLMGMPAGQRDDALFRLACKLRHDGTAYEIAEYLLLHAAANCKPPFPADLAREKIKAAYARYEPGTAQESEPQPDAPWPEPGELPSLLPKVKTLPPDMLPQALRGYLVDIAKRFQVPLEAPAVSSIISLSSIIGRNLGIWPKRRDDWLVVPNLWGMHVGQPSIQKSPIADEALKPLDYLATKASQAFDLIRPQIRAAAIARKARIEAITDLLKKEVKSEKTTKSKSKTRSSQGGQE